MRPAIDQGQNRRRDERLHRAEPQLGFISLQIDPGETARNSPVHEFTAISGPPGVSATGLRDLLLLSARETLDVKGLAGERDCREKASVFRFTLPNLSDQPEPVLIQQADIADQDVRPLPFEHLERFPDRRCRLHARARSVALRGQGLDLLKHRRLKSAGGR
jgi:hypothetical protein